MEKKFTRREMLKLTAALGATAGLSAACGGPEPAATVAPTVEGAGGEEVLTLEWLEWWGNEWGWDNLNWLIDGFEEENPGLEINVTDVAWSEMQPKLQTAALAGEGWDIYGTEDGSWIISWVRHGMAGDLTPWLEKSGPEFTDRLTEMTTVYWKGDPVMLYLYLIPFHLAYDVDRLEEMDIEPPESWEDFYQACKKFREQGEYGFSYSLRADSTQFAAKMWAYRLAQAGGRVLDRDLQAVFNKEPGVIATEWWKRFYQSDLALPGSETEDKMTTTENLATGKIAMAIDGPYIRTTAQQTNPDADIRWCPAWEAETGGYNWGGSGITIWAEGPHQEESWKFIEYFFRDDVMVHLAKQISLPMGVNAVFEQDWLSEDPMLHAVPAMQQQDPEHSWSFQPFPEGGTLWQSLSETLIACLKGEKSDIKAALDEEAGYWQETIDDALGRRKRIFAV
jgi:ABC-type glycerol-3-phosphate transport system substrate-binding protein